MLYSALVLVAISACAKAQGPRLRVGSGKVSPLLQSDLGASNEGDFVCEDYDGVEYPRCLQFDEGGYHFCTAGEYCEKETCTSCTAVKDFCRTGINPCDANGEDYVCDEGYPRCLQFDEGGYCDGEGDCEKDLCSSCTTGKDFCRTEVNPCDVPVEEGTCGIGIFNQLPPSGIVYKNEMGTFTFHYKLWSEEPGHQDVKGVVTQTVEGRTVLAAHLDGFGVNEIMFRDDSQKSEKCEDGFFMKMDFMFQENCNLEPFEILGVKLTSSCELTMAIVGVCCEK